MYIEEGGWSGGAGLSFARHRRGFVVCRACRVGVIATVKGVIKRAAVKGETKPQYRV